MSYAPNYTPTTSFADDESNQAAGRSTVRTASLDVEFANIEAAIDALDSNARKLQRDDDKLLDMLVEPYALAEQTRALIAVTGSNPRDPWAPNTAYARKDLVQRNGVALLCHTAHNSGPSFNAGFWLAISGDGQGNLYAQQASASAAAAALSEASAVAASVAAALSAGTASTAATAAGASALQAQNAADSIAGLSPVNLSPLMLDFLANAGAAGARSDIGALGLSDLPFSIVVGDGFTNNAAAIAAANTLGKPIMFTGVSVVGTPTTITVPIIDTMAQIFAAGAQVTIANGLATRPEWFGGSLDRMYASWPAAGGIGLLADKVYAPMTTQMTKGALIGTRKPRFKFNSGTGTYVGLEAGSIIQGPFPFRGNDITLSNFGVDSGSDVCAALYSGVAQEGFISGLPVAVRNERLNISDCVAICKAPTSLVHAFCLEGYTGSEVHRLDAVYGVHGVAVKMTDSNVSKLRARGCGFDGVIVKSDTATTTSERLNIDGIICASVGAYDGGGLRITNSAGGQALTGINIKNVQCGRTTYGIDFDCNDTHLVDSVNIDGVFVFVPLLYGFKNSGQARRCKVSNAIIFNSQGQGVITSKAVGVGSGTDVPEIDFFNVVTANSAAAGFELYGRNRLSTCQSYYSGGWGFLAQPGSRVTRIGCVSANNVSGDWGPGGAIYYPGETVIPFIALVLLNGWANFGAGKPEAGISITDDGMVQLTGLVKDGSLGLAIFVLPVGFRPTYEQRFLVASRNGGTNSFAHLVVQPDGTVLAEAGGGNTFVSLSGVSFRMDLT